MTLIERLLQLSLKALRLERELHNSIKRDSTSSAFSHRDGEGKTLRANGILTSNRMRLTEAHFQENGRGLFTSRRTVRISLPSAVLLGAESSPPCCFHKYSRIFFSASTQLSVEAAGQRADVRQINTGQPCEQSRDSGGGNGGHVRQGAPPRQTEEPRQQLWLLSLECFCLQPEQRRYKFVAYVLPHFIEGTFTGPLLGSVQVCFHCKSE